MELKNLTKHIRTLATLPETDSPIISCYLALEAGRFNVRHAFEECVRPFHKSLSGEAWLDFEDAWESIGLYLTEGLLPDAKGAAIFSRAGEEPFFLPLQFRVPLPNWIAVDKVPNIYHLVELKDTCHRYVVLVSTKESARILEINLGAVTKERYQKHRWDRGRKFIEEKIRVLEKLMSAGGHTHLVSV